MHDDGSTETALLESLKIPDGEIQYFLYQIAFGGGHCTCEGIGAQIFFGAYFTVALLLW